jgi:hypothetical protein
MEENTLLADLSNRRNARNNDAKRNTLHVNEPHHAHDSHRTHNLNDDTKRHSYENTDTHNPELEKIKVTHQIELENKELEYNHEDKRDVVESCCFKLRQSSLNFFGKLAISIGTVSLCSYQLINLTDCSHQTLYSGILGIIVGHWMRV